MSTEIKKEIQLEIAHVLFIDIVGYSKLSIKEQHAAVDQANPNRSRDRAISKGRRIRALIKITTGDGMALVLHQPGSAGSLRSTALRKSIGVLPFENSSEEKANAYFAEGVQSEILTKLATLRDLKVYFAHLDGKVPKQAGEPKDGGARARCFHYPRWRGAEGWRQGSGERPVNRCTR
jgi:hypothetical protein